MFAGDTIDDLIREAVAERNEQERLDNIHRLHLCRKHRQEANYAEYAEANCNHCQALNYINDLNKEHVECRNINQDLIDENKTLKKTSVNKTLLNENEQLRTRLRGLTGKSDTEITFELQEKSDGT
jgi:hypothetical protein